MVQSLRFDPFKSVAFLLLLPMIFILLFVPLIVILDDTNSLKLLQSWSFSFFLLTLFLPFANNSSNDAQVGYFLDHSIDIIRQESQINC